VHWGFRKLLLLAGAMLHNSQHTISSACSATAELGEDATCEGLHHSTAVMRCPEMHADRCHNLRTTAAVNPDTTTHLPLSLSLLSQSLSLLELLSLLLLLLLSSSGIDSMPTTSDSSICSAAGASAAAAGRLAA
jgi:hypothetical protein